MNNIFLPLYVGYAVWTHFKQRRARSELQYTKTPGTVTRSEMVTDSDSNEPVVEYTYVVKGTSYSGKNLQTLRFHALWHGRKSRILDAFPLHGTIDVFFDPAKPSRSVLKPGGDERAVAAAYLVGACFLALNYAFSH
jgi:hypothetical protein